MEYKKMIETARNTGIADESKMWKSISAVEELLEEVDDDVRYRFMRKTHEIMHGCHFDEEFYNDTIGDLSYTDRDGSHKYGGHWSVAEAESAMRGLAFGNSVTKYDKAMALNVIYSDLNSVLDDGQVIKVAWKFFFGDEDWIHKDSKIWQYMSAKEWFDSK